LISTSDFVFPLQISFPLQIHYLHPLDLTNEKHIGSNFVREGIARKKLRENEDLVASLLPVSSERGLFILEGEIILPHILGEKGFWSPKKNN
jgi:hypothetical protein